MKATTRRTKRMAACLLSCLMLPGLPALAAEEIEKNFEYYQDLSDYQVYSEYCSTYGHEAQEALPAEEELPDYWHLQYYVAGSEKYLGLSDFQVVCQEDFTMETAYALMETQEIFGFTDGWEVELDTGLGWYVSGEDRYPICDIVVNMTNLDGSMDAYIDSTIDIYRIRLTLQNSEFMKTWYAADGDPYGGVELVYINGDVPEEETVFGDIDGDGMVNAVDAAYILEYAAAAGAGNVQTLEEFMESKL